MRRALYALSLTCHAMPSIFRSSFVVAARARDGLIFVCIALLAGVHILKLSQARILFILWIET